jgi:hypothetical protein
MKVSERYFNLFFHTACFCNADQLYYFSKLMILFLMRKLWATNRMTQSQYLFSDNCK